MPLLVMRGIDEERGGSKPSLGQSCDGRIGVLDGRGAARGSHRHRRIADEPAAARWSTTRGSCGRPTLGVSAATASVMP